MGRKLFLFTILLSLCISIFPTFNPIWAFSGTINVTAKVSLSNYWAKEISEKSQVSLSIAPTLNKKVFLTVKLSGLGNLVMSEREVQINIQRNGKYWQSWNLKTDKSAQAQISFMPDLIGIYRVRASYLDPDRVVKLNQLNFTLSNTLLNKLLISLISEPVMEKL